MLELLINNTTNNLQNVYTPLPFKIHFAFCIIATLIYLLQYYRKRSLYYIFIMFAIDLTFVTQYYTSKAAIIALFIAEVVLIALAVVFSYKYNKKIKAENAAENAEKEKENAQKKEAEKAFSENEKKVIGNAFDDKEDI